MIWNEIKASPNNCVQTIANFFYDQETSVMLNYVI